MASLEESWRMFKERWPTYTGLMLIYTIITTLTLVYAGLGLLDAILKSGSLLQGGLSNISLTPILLSIIPEVLGLILVTWIASSLFDNAGIYLALNPKASLEKALKEGGKLLWQRILADIIYAVLALIIIGIPLLLIIAAMGGIASLSANLGSLVAGLIIALLIIGIIAFLFWIAFFPYKYLVVKLGSGVSAITKSLDMSKKHFGRVLITAIVIAVLSIAIYGISGFIIGASGTIILTLIVNPWLSWIYYTIMLDEVSKDL
jgi:hypothetical protein